VSSPGKAIFLSLFFLAAALQAQKPVLRNFNNHNGLPSNETYFLCHDSKGYLWICTDGGLVKYNGNFFKVFNSGNGLPDNTIFEVKEDKKGRIWYRSFSGKIGYIFNDSVFVIGANNKIAEFIKEGIVSAMALDEADHLYIGKRNSGRISFLRIKPPYTSDCVSEVWQSPTDEAGIDIVFFGENEYVFSDTRKSADITGSFRISLYNKNHRILLSEYVDVNLFKDWVGLFSRVYRDKDKIYLILNNTLKIIDLSVYSSENRDYGDILVTVAGLGDKNILIGKRKDGIRYLDKADGKFSGVLPGLTLTYAVKDYQGGTWFSTLENGIYYFPSSGVEFFTPGAESEKITTMTNIGDSALLIGFNSRKVQSLLFEGDRIKKSDVLQEGNDGLKGSIYSVFPLSSEKIFFLGENSTEYNMRSRSVKKVFHKDHIANAAKQMIRCGNDLLVLQFSNIGLVPVQKPETPGTRYASKYRVSGIACDSLNNKIYAGTLGGLYYFRYRDINDDDKIFGDRIEDIKAAKGKLYVATNTQGIFVLSNGRWDTINQQRGLASNICKTINVLNNNIWITSHSGLSRIIYRSHGDYDIYNYSFNDYLNAATPARIALLKDKAFLSSGSGVYIINTAMSKAESRFYITGFYADNKPVSGKSIVLPYNESNIKIEYSALFYDCNNEIFYRYRLLPDSGWNVTKETSVIFPELAPGSYTLSLEARAGNGTWVSSGQAPAFTICKPFWATLWFIASVVILFIGIALALIRYRYRQILKRELLRNNQRMAMRELETRVIKAQMNPHFIFNSLNSIQQFILSSDNDNAYKYLVKFSKLVRRLLESNTSPNTLLEDEINALRGYIEIEAMRFREAFEYEIRMEEGLSAQAIVIPHMLIQPFIENAIWHGLLNKKGDRKLTVSFKPNSDNSLICVVDDNGVGRKFRKSEFELNGKRSLAIDFISERLKLISEVTNISCGFTIKDNVDEQENALGTTVTIIIPIINKHGITSNNY
jgi:ligand-binding sensor domain-containing protein